MCLVSFKTQKQRFLRQLCVFSSFFMFFNIFVHFYLKTLQYATMVGCALYLASRVPRATKVRCSLLVGIIVLRAVDTYANVST